jgi:uncharacterized protein (TIGR02646 family)
MVKINFTEPKDVEWVKWRKKCEIETTKFVEAVKNNESYLVSSLYKDKKIRRLYYLSDDYKGPFWRKCAYCEGSIASQNGDIDHFRPKKRVSNDNYKPIQGHKGYYWLAYEWTNLLPSCLKCNQRKIWEKDEGNITVGKLDRFPLEDENKRVFDPGTDLSSETPLLINPLIEYPEDHLEVELRTGIITWKTPRGKKCVEVFGLNIRDDLRDGRRAAVDRVRSLITQYSTYIQDNENQKIYNTLIEIMKYVNGEKQFSLAAKIFLKNFFGTDYCNQLEEKLVRFKSNY